MDSRVQHLQARRLITVSTSSLQLEVRSRTSKQLGRTHGDHCSKLLLLFSLLVVNLGAKSQMQCIEYTTSKFEAQTDHMIYDFRA